MTIQRTTGGVFADVTTLKRRLNGAWVDVLFAERVWRREAGAWVDLFPALGSGGFSVSASDTDSLGLYTCVDPETPPYICPTLKSITTSAITVTASGGSGVGPTYAWTRVSGDSGFTCNSPSAATTTWTINVPQNTTKTAIWRCTATRGVDSDTVDIEVSATYVRSGGSGGLEP